jgi:hypothetical protein
VRKGNSERSTPLNARGSKPPARSAPATGSQAPLGHQKRLALTRPSQTLSFNGTFICDWTSTANEAKRGHGRQRDSATIGKADQALARQ